MATIAILGAGLGGVLAAYEVKAEARPADKVVLISKGDNYHFVPSNPWVGVGWRDREAIEVNLPPVMKRRASSSSMLAQSACTRPKIDLS